ncbi:hypothetical protein [Candidatus Cardinium hertigii]|uniref:Uncharacterized protein n=1 Tax=Candidatus Cardinium hertigii TaxID=247481 RepID=A0A2Z3L9K7_9BACT|nr:hypothetical protein [Candidatus Cardinium hertigii]AWN82051.1 hypothetical protein DK880_00741 [Candidatus Cardinium hertigii]
MIQSVETVLQKLQKGSYAPIYFLQGEEPYYYRCHCKTSSDTLLTPAEKSFNLTIFMVKNIAMTTLGSMP